MYNNNLIVAVKKSNGDTLRESSPMDEAVDSSQSYKKATISLPFDSEYQLYIKNNAATRAVVSITIDGTDVLGGHRLVIDPHSEHTLERFILDGNLEKGRKFKFVSLQNEAVQNPQEPKNGLVEIKCRWELEMPPVYIPVDGTVWAYPPYVPDTPYRPWYPRPVTWQWGTFCGTGGAKSNTQQIYTMQSRGVGGTAQSCVRSMSVQNFSSDAEYQSAVSSVTSPDQKGATVEGSQSNQSFHLTSVGALKYGETTIAFQILAPKSENQPVTVKATRNKYCTACGTKLPKDAKFCMTCGVEQPV